MRVLIDIANTCIVWCQVTMFAAFFCLTDLFQICPTSDEEAPVKYWHFAILCLISNIEIWTIIIGINAFFWLISFTVISFLLISSLVFFTKGIHTLSPKLFVGLSAFVLSSALINVKFFQIFIARTISSLFVLFLLLIVEFCKSIRNNLKVYQ